MNSKLKNSFIFNLFLVFVMCIVLYMMFFSSLSFLTSHNDQSIVPDVMNKPVKLAVEKLEKLGYDVEIDSTYDPNQKPLLVLGMMPEIGASVKRGRTIFLTVNKSEPPLTPMPKLTDLSFRSAIRILESARLVIGDTIHKPDFAKGAVLEQMFRGKVVRPGDMVPQGSRIDLVIGDGFGSVEMDVPEVIGLSAEEGISILSASGLVPTIIWDGAITDSASAIIYKQTPTPYNELEVPNRIKEGDVLDIRIKQNPSAEELERNRIPETGVMEPAPNTK